MGDGERLLRCFRESSTGILQLAEIEEREVCVCMFVYFAHAWCMHVCVHFAHAYVLCVFVAASSSGDGRWWRFGMSSNQNQ